MAALALVAAASAGNVANGDVRYTTQMSMHKSDSDGKKAAEVSMRTLNLYKDDKIRSETTMAMGPMTMQTVTISDCAAHQLYTVSPTLKIYTRSTLDSTKPAFLGSIGNMSMGGPGRGRPMMQQPQNQPSGTGKEIITYSMDDLGTEKVLELDCHHFMITMRTQSSGCPGNKDNTIKIEEWVADVQAGIACLHIGSSTSGGPGADAAPDTNPCKVTTEVHGDVKGIWSVFGKLPARTKIYMDAAKPDDYMLIELREYSKAPLDADPFAIPADYKEVSVDEFQKAKQQEMMQRMMGGRTMPQMPDNVQQQQQQAPSQTPLANGDDNTDNPTPNQTKKHVYPMLPGGIKLPF